MVRFSRIVALAGLTLIGGAAHAQAPAETMKLAEAPPGTVRLFVAGSLRAPVTALKAQLEQATGRTVIMEVTESRILQREIEAGQPFEAAMLTTAVLDACEAQMEVR